jgi:HPt (histidine-containing phosphotransfer) domain-containing protein
MDNAGMDNENFRVMVAKDLASLVPQFLSNRLRELGSLESALQRADFAVLRRIAHGMKGLGGSYGFHRISVLGKKIEQAAMAGKTDELLAQIAQYGEYLAKVRVCYT